MSTTQAELVTLGFSPQQAVDLLNALADNPNVAQMVADGFFAETARVVADPASTAADLVRAGFSTVQAEAVR